MKIEQIYTGCLAQGAYYIESEGEVAIIDPLREVSTYLEKVQRDNAKVKYIFETHFHADFVSGHVTLSQQTGAPIIYGPNANPSFDAVIADDGQEFKLGEVTIVVLHTPGHTMESATFLLRDSKGKDYAIFSGDTLFLGDVGRPDLAQKAEHMTKEQLAGTLYESLRNQIMPLDDDVIVYPAHGAGSACGKNMMKKTVDTLGNQKKVNYALRADMTKEEFVREVIDGLQPPPKYFPFNVKMNQEGYSDIKEIVKKGTRALEPETFEDLANEIGALILDVRHPEDFSKGHIPKSIFIGLDGSFAPWVGALIVDVKQPILVVAPHGREEETVTRLTRVGFDNALGYLKGSFDTWRKASKEYDSVSSISAEEFRTATEEGNPSFFDVRKKTEYDYKHLESSHNIPLDYINSHLDQFPLDNVFYLYCSGGYRSMTASSILKSRGIHNLINVKGGIEAIWEVWTQNKNLISTSSKK